MTQLNAILDYPQNRQGLTIHNNHRQPKPAKRLYHLVERTDLNAGLKPFFYREFEAGSPIETVTRWFEARAGYWSGQMNCILHQVQGEHHRICAYTTEGEFRAELIIIEQYGIRVREEQP